MVTLISKDNSVVERLASALSESEGKLLERDYDAIAKEYLAEERAVEQIEYFKKEIARYSNDYDFTGKKLLEIGAGVGSLILTARNKYGIDAYGVEPSENEFSPFSEISETLFKEYKLDNSVILNAKAESLPFESNSFDLVYSTNVLEHVDDPTKVLSESIRVLKPGGYLQFVIPNYFSLWEGHYEMLWPFITNKFLAKIYLKLIGKKTDYVETLNLISPFYLKKVLKSIPYKVQVLNWGQDIFKNRLGTGLYSDWAALKKIRWMIVLVQKLKIASLIANIMNMFGMYTPIVITLKKSD